MRRTARTWYAVASMRQPHHAPLVALAWLMVVLSACADLNQAQPATTCSKAEDKCTMPSGVLGVCNVVDCTAGEPGPCLVCRSQH